MSEPKPLYRCDLCKAVDYNDEVVGCKRCGFDEMVKIATPTDSAVNAGAVPSDVEGVLRAALAELLDAWLTEFPPSSAGVGAQDAWADRRSAARDQARAALAPKADSSEPRAEESHE